MLLHRSAPLILSMACASVVLAQPRQIVVGAAAPGVVAGAKDLQSVYVRDSGVASERLALAERMERLKEWDKAADVYQEIIEKYADRVVPTRTDSNDQVMQYMSVALVVQEKLARWPAEGLEAYRRRYEDIAREKLDAAAPGNRAALTRVMALYFATDAGKDAGLRLMADSFERGEFASAAWIGRRLIGLHPSLVTERANVLFQTALAEHLAGNDAQAQQKLAELSTKHADATATVAGVDVKIADALASELKQQPSLIRTFRSDSWPMPFGTPDASAVPEQISTGGARLFGVEISGLASRTARARAAQQLQRFGPMENRPGNTTGILPSIDNGELFFQDNARVYAINLASGLPLTGWQQTYPGEKRGVYSIDALPLPAGTQLGVNVTSDRVVAVLGQVDQMGVMMGFGMQQQQQQAMLVSLDRATGKRQWSATLGKMKLPDDLATLREGTFYGTPLIEGDTIYAPVRVLRGGQFEECHLVALQLSDGAYKWSSYIASTSAGSRFQDIDGDGARTGATAQVSYSDGRLYVLTNLGAVACLDATDGNTLWLNVYARANDAESGPMAVQRQFIQQPRSAGKPFAINPPIITDGRLFVMPSDSPSMFVYDAASGEQTNEIGRRLDLGRSMERYQTMDMLLAVRGEKLVLANRSTVASMPWRALDPKKSLVDNGGVYKTFSGSEGDANDVIRGRPFVSQKYVLVPTTDKLVRISIDNWKTENTYPASGAWDEEEQAGNVLATPDHLIIAGPSRVTAYTDLGVATAKLDQRIAQAPGEVEPYLRYAELLLAGGKAPDALPYIDKAVDRLGGAKSLQSGDLRDRLFEISCSFAIKLQRAASTGAPGATSADVLRQLYDRARDAAEKPQQQVRYRLALASLLRGQNDLANELALHQQVLSNPDWRTAPVAGRAGTSTAGSEAAQAISEIIQQAGVAIYAPYEAKAAELLAAAQADATTDGNRLLAIADEFPTSAACTEALTLAADRFESSQPRLASQTLRRLLKRELSTERRLVTLESLARTYLATPGQLDTAIVRLQQAAKLNGSAQLTRPLPIPDGRTLERVTYVAAQEILQKHRNSAIVAALPTLGTPSPSTGADPLLPALQPAVEVAAASEIVDQQSDVARHDRVVAYSQQNGVIQLAVGSRQPNGRPVTFSESPIGCAYSGDSLVVVGPTQAMAINADGTKTLWRLSLNQLPGAEIATAPAQEPEADENKDGGGNVVMPFPRQGRVNIRGRALIINGGMQADVDAVAAGGPERIFNYRVLSDRLVLGTTSGRVISIDLATGRSTWQTRPSEQIIRHFLTTEDFVVVSYTEQNPATGQLSSEVVVLDAITGQITQRNQYTAETGQQLVNLALSRDGVLVSMVPRGLRARDLYDPKAAEWKQDTIGGPQGNEMAFINSVGPEQLVITDDRVLVLYRSNNGQQSVRAYKLRDELKPMKFRDEKTGREFEASYNSRVKPEVDNSQLAIRAVGPAFYIFGQKSLMAYNLDKPQSQWGPSGGTPPIARDFVLGQDVAALLCNPASVPNPGLPRLPSIQMLLYSRLPTASGGESGVLDQRIAIKDPASIVVGQWQLANGAFYYVSGDQKLKMMTATPTPAKQ